MKNSSPKRLLESALDILRAAASGKPFANQTQLARATGESEANISRWLSGNATPTLRKLEPVLSSLGVRFVMPETRSRQRKHAPRRRTSGRSGRAHVRPCSGKRIRGQGRSRPGVTTVIRLVIVVIQKDKK